jgi:acyl-CoA synthetase (NDP forming)
MAVESTAIILTDRIDALAAALRAAGVTAEQSSSLLASAASATMHALTLDALLEERPLQIAELEPAVAAETQRPVLARVPLAA